MKQARIHGKAWLALLLALLLLPGTPGTAEEPDWAAEVKARVPEALTIVVEGCRGNMFITGPGVAGDRSEELDIRGCRLIRLAEEETAGTPFEDVQYVVEFLALADYLGNGYTIPTSNLAVTTEAWITRDGQIKLSNYPLMIFVVNRLKYPVIAEVVDLGDEYNQVISFAAE